MDRKEHHVRAEVGSNWNSYQSGLRETAEHQPLRSQEVLSIAIAATFAADPLERPLKFWMEKLGVRAEIELAPYGQMMQALLDPHSPLSQNKVGFNFILIRPQDWIRDRLATESLQSNLDHLRRAMSDLVSALGAFRARTSGPIFVFLGPSSSSLSDVYRQALEESHNELVTRIAGFQHVHCWAHGDLLRLYPLPAYEDPEADRIGHLPYTNDYYVAVATLMARRVAALVRSPFKVIAIDCDNTLWKGTCGEDGPDGIELTAAHLQFQALLIRQYDAGMLLCICSKNNASDVEEVFRTRADMLLKEEHIVSWRANWKSKSANLRSLAEELDLSPDSFIFIDDSAAECAEVRLLYPSILTLQFPQIPEEIEHFLDHTWAFDRVAVTQEGKQRTAQYRENRSRKAALEQAGDLERFLTSLELIVSVSVMQQNHLPRVTELLQRTNQFNLTAIRRSLAEIENLWLSHEIQVLVVHVKDRFGDYGLVGALFLRHGSSSMEVETFVLSCRVLGRGVEHRVINELGRMAGESSLKYVMVRYRETPRNRPAWEFLERSFGQFRSPWKNDDQVANQSVFTIPVDYAKHVAVSSPAAKVPSEGAEPITGSSTERSPDSTRWHEQAYRLSRLPDIVREVGRRFQIQQKVHTDYVAPRNPIEAAVAGIWAEVLGIEQVSMRDDFFRLGGDSVRAVRVVARVASGLGFELPLDEFYEEPTVENIAARLARASRAGVPITRVDRSERLPLSWAQQRLWFIDRLEGGSLAYHIPVAIRLRGELDRTALQAAMDGLVRRHEALRTIFTQIGGEPIQVITPPMSVVLGVLDLIALKPAEREAEVQRCANEELATPFDLSAGPLFRGKLLLCSEGDHLLVLTMHHIVSDGWSVGVLVRELAALYRARVEGQADSLPPLSIQYADYAYWQRRLAGGAELAAQLAYWEKHLGGAPEVLQLPTDRPRPAVRSYEGASVTVSLGSELTVALRALSRELNLTLAMTLFTAWSIVLARLSGQDEVVLGMPVANRRRSELEGLIGFFVNTVAVRVGMGDDPLLSDLLQHVKRTLVEAYVHQDVPFEQVVEALQPARSLSHNPVFQVMFVLQNPPVGVMQLPGLTLSEEQVPLHTAQVDLLLSLQESDEEITGVLNFSTDLFERSTILKWVGCYETVLTGLVQQPGLRVSRVPLASEEQRHQLVTEFNDTGALFPRDRLIQELFEEQVARTPEAVAVTFEGQSLTYADLNKKASQLARRLIDKGVRPDQLVGICVERSLEMVIGLLGILKAGGAYIPLDPTYPPERLAYILVDAAPRVLVTQSRLRTTLPATTAEFIELDSERDEGTAICEENLNRSFQQPDSRHLAYVLYTSGSTGRPKGVMVEHSAVVNFLTSMLKSPGIVAADRMLAVTTISFDIAALEIYLPLVSGATLVLASREAASDPRMLIAMIEEMDVTILQGTPATWQLLLSGGWLGRKNLKALCGGEALTRGLAEKLANRVAVLWNLYGPTETTIWSCGRQVPASPDQLMSVESIGRPIANTQVHILDQWHQLVPIGAPGEVCIGGAGVARGYLGRPELTAERFINDPFSAETGGRLYRTGDLGRWRSDGTIDYLGRNDRQVKIRGFRIELGEIEAQLAKHAEVKNVIAIMREDVPGEKRLVAYVVPETSDDMETAVRAETLRAHLRTVLPEYMVPNAIALLDRMPLTPNGKLDRRALPAPELEAYVGRQYQPPQGATEEIVAGIWRELMSLERVGRQDNFFVLGGHSLMAVEMIERLRRAGLFAKVRRVFEAPTLAEFASTLTRDAIDHSPVPPNLIPPGCDAILPKMLSLVELEPEHITRIVQSVPGGAANVQDIYPLAPLQEGILFHYLLRNAGGDTYIAPILLSVSSRDRLEDLIAALQAVIDRHDVLRTAVLWEQLPRPVQVVYRQASLPVDELRLTPDRDVVQQINAWLQPERQWMDLRQAPLMRLQIAPDPRGAQWYVLLQFHHIVGDNTSREVALTEVVDHMEGRLERLSDSVPYRNYVAHALAHARLHDAEAFFRKKLEGINEPTAPFGLMDVHGDGHHIQEAHGEFDAELANAIRTQARRLGVSAATLFHATWGLVVAHTTGRDDVVFGSVLLGRFNRGADAHRSLGLFINTLPLRLRLRGLTAKELVEQTQRELVDLLSHEQASLAVAQRCSGVAGSSPLFSSLLNYRQGNPSPQAQWAGAKGIQVLATQDRTNYPITLSVDDLGVGFVLTAQADQRIDPQRIIEYSHTGINSLVKALEQSARTPALALPILPACERHLIIETFNATRAVYPHEMLIHELVEEQAQRRPDAIAVIYEGHSVTYSDLNGKANQLARYLTEQGMRTGEYIPILMPRCLQMVIAQLAVLKSGGVYVPVDPDMPTERQAFVIQDCRARRVILYKSVGTRFEQGSVQYLDIAKATDSIAALAKDNLGVQMGAAPPAYVMYTSGSSGLPKGVIVPHHAVIRLVINADYVQIEPTDCIAHCSNPAFDASTFEIWGALLNGARMLVVPPSLVLQGDSFTIVLGHHQVTVLWLTVGLLSQYSEALSTVFTQLRYLITGGDIVEPEMVRRLMRHSPPKHLLNAYGPTECTTFSATYHIQSIAEGTIRLPIGRPISNAQMYVLNDLLQPAPIGVTGEIYIGGAGVANGYLNRPELTAERFICDPFDTTSGARLYRTGDLGQWRPDGFMVFLGRNDSQVKIRGYRVEPGEVEAQLALHPRVKEAVVIVREDAPGEKRLVAYLIAQRAEATEAVPSVGALREYMSSVLPNYMVPSAFVILEAFPLTPNGKVDRRALPAPGLEAHASRQYEPLRGEIEVILGGIWQALLGVERIGRYDHFFELGGHSLLALNALVEINQSLASTLSITDIYKYPTIHDLAARIERGATFDELVNLSQEAILDDEIVVRSSRRQAAPRGIMLTGSTGFVGRFLLAQLLLDTDERIYCLLRAKSSQQAESRVKATLSKWNLWREEFEDRIIAIPGDISVPRLGLDDASHQLLVREVGTIYHCATSMNHLETYAMAKPTNVNAVRDLLRLATHGTPKLINYVSTLSVFHPTNANGTRVVDENSPIEHENHLTSHGYAASKWVAEKIFMTARERGVPCNIFRVGLVWADAKQGRYDDLQTPDRFFKSCLFSGYGIKDCRYESPPTPVDYVAQAIVYLGSQHPDGQGIFHISSTTPMATGLYERCNEFGNMSLKLLPYYEWISEIRRLYQEGRSLPAVPLIEFAFSMDEQSFYDHQRRLGLGRLRFDCARTQQELERSGIVAPVFNDNMLKVYVKNVLSQLGVHNSARSKSAMDGALQARSG